MCCTKLLKTKSCCFLKNVHIFYDICPQTMLKCLKNFATLVYLQTLLFDSGFIPPAHFCFKIKHCSCLAICSLRTRRICNGLPVGQPITVMAVLHHNYDVGVPHLKKPLWSSVKPPVGVPPPSLTLRRFFLRH